MSLVTQSNIPSKLYASFIFLAAHCLEGFEMHMRHLPGLSLFALASVALVCVRPLSADDPNWMEKSIPQWDDQDAKQILADSPWVKTVQPERVRDLSGFERRDGGNWDAGIKPGIGLTGLFTPDVEALLMELSRARATPKSLTVRWESAMPVRAAEQKAGEVSAPVWQGDYYAIAVYDVTPPFRWNLANELKDIAFLKRDKKKDVKPTRVEVIRHDGGLATIVYLFARTAEITRKDSNVRFVAQIGRLFVSQFFFPEDMQFQGKPEL
jgi:hypothetical protein